MSAINSVEWHLILQRIFIGGSIVISSACFSADLQRLDRYAALDSKSSADGDFFSEIHLDRNGIANSVNGFPAISSDSKLLAVLQISDPHEPSTFLNVYRTKDFGVEQRFSLFDRHEFHRAQNSVEENAALAAFYDAVELATVTANNYLHAQRFRPIDLLYDLQGWLHQPRSIDRRNEDLAVWRMETAKWSLSFAPATDVFQIRSIETTEKVFSVRPPIEVYGIARPGLLCRARPRPYRGWYDSAAEVLIVRFGYFTGLTSCDIDDKWMLQRLGNP